MEDKRRMNAGYEIIQSVPVGTTEFVLGQSIHTGAQFVTWECTGGNNYFGDIILKPRKKQLPISTTVWNMRCSVSEKKAQTGQNRAVTGRKDKWQVSTRRI